ncbi:MAG TPA: TolC family protein [Pirellulales bacterium]|jgi:outer membrane protein TolC|nr:TolC family protein [Pirellulales bacterium]
MLLFTAPAAVLYGQSPETVPRGNPSFGYDPRPEYQQRPASPARLCPSSLAWLQGEPEPAIPNLSDAGAAPNIPAAQPEQIDAALPINLATAMRLSSARPLVIQAAIASEMTSYGRVQQAQVLWLPDLILGSDYQRHDGGQQRAEGEVSINDRNQFLTGGGLKAIFALADAIYEPLSAKQLYRARNYDVQAAKNDALLDMTDAYFLVQQSRGVLAGDEDAVAKGRELLKTVQSLSQGLAAPIEVQRAQTTLAELEQRATTARQDWRINSANLTRVLRLNPAAVIVPLEPPQLQVTIVSPEKSVDELIPEGLLTRPELASQKAVVQATIARLKQERMRPLIPSLVVQGSANPGDTLGAGFYEANVTGANPISTGRSDWDFQVVWELQNLGAGNAGLVHERMGEERQAMVELFRVQDRVAAEIVQAQAQVIAAAARIKQAEYGLASAEASFKGNLKGLSETIQVGQQLELVIRPQEVTAALLQLQQAYSDYYTSINDYNRAEFRLYHALGFPAQQMTCNPGWGDPQPTNCQRPPEMGSSAVATVYRPTEHR